jgi:UPF0271 protein
MRLKLNCDMGEHFGIYTLGLDELIMPHINMANLACGFHASDALTMQKSVQLAKQHNISIGAHPSYQDLVGFGRRSIRCTSDEIIAKILYQIGALDAFCKANDTKISYVKPHGALYNDMMKDETIFRAILEAVSSYDSGLKLMILSTTNNKKYKKIANEYSISLLYELFADRNYSDDGFLVPRTQPNATISSKEEVLKRVKTIQKNGYIKSINGKKLYLKIHTLCVHGDNEQALEFILLLKKAINK